MSTAVGTTTMKMWGNSAAARFKLNILQEAGAEIGSVFNVSIEGGNIILSPVEKKYHRTQKLKAADVFEGWQGEYVSPGDFDSLGCEISSGQPVGNEAW